MDYSQLYQQSIEQPELFWRQRAEQIDWYKKPSTILSVDELGSDRWFADGELNTAYLALDYHVENGRAEQTALIYDSPVTDTVEQYSYRELRDQVARFAGVLLEQGIEKGDRVIIYMPMVPQALVAMYACARLGAVHSVVFGGFAARELAIRIDDAKPKLLLAASCGIEVDKVIPYKPLVDQAVQLAEFPPQRCIILQRPQLQAEMIEGQDLDWQALTSRAQPADPVPVKATDPLYILYTSGTTGKPKGVVRDNGGHAVALKYSMKAVYDINPGEVFWAASDIGWVVGHSYIIYAPLLAGCTTLMYEGKPVRTPDAGAFWRVIEQHKVKACFAAPTAFRAIKKEDPEGTLKQKYDLSSMTNLFLAGERLDPPTYYWLKELCGVPVIDHWWQTETGWAIAGNPMGLGPRETKAGSATLPSPGFNVQIVDEAGKTLPAGKQGEVVIKRPLPPSCLPTLWDDHQRFIESYMSEFPGYYLTGDGGYFDDEGYLFIMGRTDDVINVAGHRLSTGEIEEVIASHNAVAECAVISQNDSLKGQLPIGFAVLKDGVELEPAQLQAEVVAKVRNDIGPIACFKQLMVVKRLPKTRSGKILRKTMKSIANGEPYTAPGTIDDPVALEEIAEALNNRSSSR